MRIEDHFRLADAAIDTAKARRRLAQEHYRVGDHRQALHLLTNSEQLLRQAREHLDAAKAAIEALQHPAPGVAS
jgi:threonine dehydrogenase-like Zn-dependent dehydrogenase